MVDAKVYSELLLERRHWEKSYKNAMKAIDSLFDKIKQGDNEHQQWLKAAIEEHFRSCR